jgi:hypothetical protein
VNGGLNTSGDQRNDRSYSKGLHRICLR